MIKEAVESVEGFGGEVQERRWCLVPKYMEGGIRFEGVEVGISGFRREKILFTGTEVTTGWVR